MSVFGLTPFVSASPRFASPFAGLLDGIARESAQKSAQSGSGLYGGDYNIERISDDKYRIQIAALGLDEDDIDIEEQSDILSVRATPKEESTSLTALHATAFERHFHLDEHMRVGDAVLDKGLLSIALTREIPEREKPRKINLVKALNAK